MQRAEFAPIYQFPLAREYNFLSRETSLVEMLRVSPVYERIVEITTNRLQYGLPENWFELPRTGFWINAQMRTLDRELQREDISPRAAFDNWIKDTEVEEQANILEYLLRGKCVFPDSYEIEERNGKNILVSPRSGRKHIQNIFLAQERNGKLQKSLLAFEEFMVNAPDDSICVIDSVSGPSNLFVTENNEIVQKEEGGKEIIFPDDQCYIFQKKGNVIHGFSIRTDADHKKASDFLKKLDNRDISPYATPEEFISQVCMFNAHDPNNKIHSITDVLSIMQQAHGSRYAYTDTKRNIFTEWKDLYTDIQREDLYDFNDVINNYIRDFSYFAWIVYEYVTLTEVMDGNVRVREHMRDILQKGLAATILAITSYLYKADTEILARRGENISPSDKGYGAAYRVMVAVGGCSSSGEKSTNAGLLGEKVIDFGSPRFGLLGGEDDSLTFNCPNCNWPHARKSKEDWIYNCVHCGRDVSCGRQKPSVNKKDSDYSYLPVQKTRRKN